MLSLADDFSETAIQGILAIAIRTLVRECYWNDSMLEFDDQEAGDDSDAVDDFHDLIDAWKELTVILMAQSD